MYGAWSDWSYISPSQEVTLQKSEESIHASWTKVKGADRYLVYISTDKDSGYKKCVVTSKTSCKITKYGNKKIKSGTRYYVYVVPQVKVSGVYKSAAKRDVVTEVE